MQISNLHDYLYDTRLYKPYDLRLFMAHATTCNKSLLPLTPILCTSCSVQFINSNRCSHSRSTHAASDPFRRAPAAPPTCDILCSQHFPSISIPYHCLPLSSERLTCHYPQCDIYAHKRTSVSSSYNVYAHFRPSRTLNKLTANSSLRLRGCTSGYASASSPVPITSIATLIAHTFCRPHPHSRMHTHF